MSTATDNRTEALHQRYAKYAVKFVNDSGGAMPTDMNLDRVLAGCVRPAHPEEYAAIREHVNTYLDGREARGRDVRAALRERADSYASDARKFADMRRLGQTTDVLTGEDCQRYATMCGAIAEELRKVADAL